MEQNGGPRRHFEPGLVANDGNLHPPCQFLNVPPILITYLDAADATASATPPVYRHSGDSGNLTGS